MERFIFYKIFEKMKINLPFILNTVKSTDKSHFIELNIVFYYA
ncbi:hypothetical protein M2373_000166 [Chryseobacterium sp. JUb7]|nr:hypothetical protein [Chryseobacterium sp. JUb7]